MYRDLIHEHTKFRLRDLGFYSFSETLWLLTKKTLFPFFAFLQTLKLSVEIHFQCIAIVIGNINTVKPA